jgi:hypothetical protein
MEARTVAWVMFGLVLITALCMGAWQNVENEETAATVTMHKMTIDAQIKMVQMRCLQSPPQSGEIPL